MAETEYPAPTGEKQSRHVSASRQLADYERGFRRAGLPLFVEGFSASTDVFNRAAPLLGVILIGELLGAARLDWSWWQNVLAMLGGWWSYWLGSGWSTWRRGGRCGRSRGESARPRLHLP